VAVAADVTVDGRRLGEIAEAVVDLEPRQHPGPGGAPMHEAHTHRHGDGPEHTHHSTGWHGANV
jgi:hypothetical protein